MGIEGGVGGRGGVWKMREGEGGVENEGGGGGCGKGGREGGIEGGWRGRGVWKRREGERGVWKRREKEGV